MVALERFSDYANSQQNNTNSTTNGNCDVEWKRALEYAMADIELKFRKEMHLVLAEEGSVREKGNIETGLIDVSTVVFATNRKTWNKFLELGGHSTVEKIGKRRAFERVEKLNEMYQTGSIMYELKQKVALQFARLQLEQAVKTSLDNKIADLVDLSVNPGGENTFIFAWKDGTAKIYINEDTQFVCHVSKTTFGGMQKDLTLSFLVAFDTLSNLITQILISSVQRILKENLGSGKYKDVKITAITPSSLMILLKGRAVGSIYTKVNINKDGDGFQSFINIIQKKSDVPKAPLTKTTENLTCSDIGHSYLQAISVQHVVKQEFGRVLMQCFENLM